MNSPLAYIGGKSKLSETIINMIPEHRAYCEVFAGAAWVFSGKSHLNTRRLMIWTVI